MSHIPTFHTRRVLAIRTVYATFAARRAERRLAMAAAHARFGRQGFIR